MKYILILLLIASPAVAADQCLGVNSQASVSFSDDVQSSDCHVRMSATGYPLPDPKCTPGAANPTVTENILRDTSFRTRCVRDGATSAAQKRSVYAAYGIKKPAHNAGKTQICELDHLSSLEIAGADTLDNIWPQCGPANVPLAKRWFKIKDMVENYLAREVKAGRMSIEEAQHGIAVDWSQYVPMVTKSRQE